MNGPWWRDREVVGLVLLVLVVVFVLSVVLWP